MDDAAEDKILRNSYGVDTAKHMSNYNGMGSSIAGGSSIAFKAGARLLPHDPSLARRA